MTAVERTQSNVALPPWIGSLQSLSRLCDQRPTELASQHSEDQQSPISLSQRRGNGAPFTQAPQTQGNLNNNITANHLHVREWRGHHVQR